MKIFSPLCAILLFGALVVNYYTKEQCVVINIDPGFRKLQELAAKYDIKCINHPHDPLD